MELRWINMSELDRFIGVEEIREVDGVKLKFTPLGAENVSLLIALQVEEDITKRTEAMNKLFVKYMKDNFPDDTPEKILKVKLDFYSKVMKIILEINGYDTSRITEITEQRKQ
jgi:hypothetical protein